jgi:hypothetical protein
MGIFSRLWSSLKDQGNIDVDNKKYIDNLVNMDRMELQYQIKPSDPPIKFIGRHQVDKTIFMQVRSTLRENKEISVRELAKFIGLGKSTIYRIKAAKSWGDYKNDSK